ncbi:MAG: ADP-forming succinate--CoA ligase subunit beta [Verrucomicrobia bacterium]|nr:ADP-forming succinate--CoA ligase subunit beta [Verrucomicrobiota bacterium]
MNIHEYQASELLAAAGVTVPRGVVAHTAEEAESIARNFSWSSFMVKAQVHAGGRGKGHFQDGFKGGVHLVKTPQQVRDIAAKMIGNTLITHQTGPEGKPVHAVLICEPTEIARELYLAIVLDRSSGCPVIVASRQGGMEIETVAEKNPEAILREKVHPSLGLQPYQARKLSIFLGFPSTALRAPCRLLHAAYRLFIDKDCSQVEINPLAVTKGGDVCALDAKLNFDDNAIFRHKEIEALSDPSQEDPRDLAAAEHHLNYIGLDGNIGCMVNGAGLAMATLDLLQAVGGRPANFLDVGGGASKQMVTVAFRLLQGDPSVKAILVNIFGGILKCDLLAQGMVAACHNAPPRVPIIVRMQGTNVDAGRKILKESGLALIPAEGLMEAAEKAVAAASGKKGK